MDSGIVWLLLLLAVEAAMFVFTLYLARTFTRSHDREWLDDVGAPSATTAPSARFSQAPVPEHQRAEA